MGALYIFVYVISYLLFQLEFQLKSVEEGVWKPTQEGLVDKKLTKINLDKLQTGKKYAFRIAAVNKVGLSPYAEVGPAVCAYLVGTYDELH